MNRGDVYDVEWPGAGRHPVVIVTRQVAIPHLTSVTVALVTSTIRDLPTEVPLDESHGLKHDCVVNCDNLLSVPKAALARHVGTLERPALDRLAVALMIALQLD